MARQIGAVNQSTNGRISSPNHPRGLSAILNFGARKAAFGNTFVYPFGHDENGEDSLDEFFNQPEKKRRLSTHQVQFLEKCFIADNKLEPNRKIRIAKRLDLQPRQITIWFQNRRARSKMMQLETDFEELNRKYDRLKTEYDSLVNEHEKLKSEIVCLKTSSIFLQHRNDSYLGEPVTDNFDDDLVSRYEEQSSVTRDLIYEEGLIEYPNPIQNQEDEYTQQPDYVFSKVEVSRFLPNGNGFYFEVPVEDPAISFWS